MKRFTLRHTATNQFLMLALTLAWCEPTHAKSPITALRLSPRAEAVLVASQASLEIREWPEITRVSKHTIPIAHIHDLQFSPNGKQLLIVGGQPSELGEWQVYEWPSLAVVASNTHHEDVIHSAVWVADDRFITGAADHQVIEWQLAGNGNATALRRMKGHSRRVLAVAFCKQSDLIVSAGVDHSLRVWDNRSKPPRANAEVTPVRVLDNHTGIVRDLAVRPGDHTIPYLASASADKTVRIWQPSIGRLVRFARLPSEPLAIAWTSDGSRLAASCIDGKLRIINPDTVTIERTEDAITGWAYAVLPVSKEIVLVGGTANALGVMQLTSQAK